MQSSKSVVDALPVFGWGVFVSVLVLCAEPVLPEFRAEEFPNGFIWFFVGLLLIMGRAVVAHTLVAAAGVIVGAIVTTLVEGRFARAVSGLGVAFTAIATTFVGFVVGMVVVRPFAFVMLAGGAGLGTMAGLRWHRVKKMVTRLPHTGSAPQLRATLALLIATIAYLVLSLIVAAAILTLIVLVLVVIAAVVLGVVFGGTRALHGIFDVAKGAGNLRPPGFDGEYVADRSSTGESIGRSRERVDYSGRAYVEHEDAMGNVVGRSHEKGGLFGSVHVEHEDARGRPVGVSREQQGMFGHKYMQREDNEGNIVSNAQEEGGQVVHDIKDRKR